MSVIGSHCLVLTSGQLYPGIIRAASQPAYRTSNFSQIKVLLEWGEGKTLQREWADLSKGDKFQAVYVEQGLLWAKRILPSEQQRAVAWPSKAFTLLCGSVIPHTPDTVVVEYFCDKERAQLYLPETKELVLSEAKLTLVQHPQMLQELTEWEERMKNKELLSSGSSLLTGCHVSICNVQQLSSWISGIVTAHNLQTNELTVVEDNGGGTHIVNPLMIHLVMVGEESPQPSSRRRSLQQSLLDTDNSTHQQQQQQQMWMHAQPPSTITPNLTPESLPPISSPTALTSPHPLSSPIIQECQSPHFNLNGHNLESTIYRTPSVDLQRRSSLQQVNASLMRSEPNLFRRSSMDTVAMQCSFDIQDSLSLNRAPLHVLSPSTSMASAHNSPMGSSTQLTRVGSNSTLNDFPEAEEFLHQERSKSLDNINIFGIPHPAQKRRSSLVGSRNALAKKPRFDILPALREKGVAPPNRSLSRSASQPSIFPQKFKGKQLATKFLAAVSSTSHSHQRDDLDMIQQIINEDLDDGLVSSQLRSVSLSHIPGCFNSSSLPSLPHAGSIAVLHSNYNSAPDFSHIRSPPNYDFSTVQQTTPPMATLTHESRSSSMSDFVSEQATDPATPFSIPQDRRNSEFDLHGLPTPAQSTPTAGGTSFDLHCGVFDFNNHRRSSVHSTQSSSCPSDGENRIPGFDMGRRGSAQSAGISGVTKSFQFPNPTSSSCDTQQPETNVASSSSAPLSKLLSSSLASTKPTENMPLFSEHSLSSPTLIKKVENPAAGFSDQPYSGKEAFHSHIVSEVEFLSPLVEDRVSKLDTIQDQGEFSISRIINPRLSDEGREEGIDMIGDDESEEGFPLQSLDSSGLMSPLGILEESSPSNKKKKIKKKTPPEKPEQPKRGRGRPRLTEEEKQRRKELRELGLMKRSKRRTKEEVAQWRAEKILTPAKRGRKPGSGKKNIIKAATGKVVFVTVDLSQYQNGTILLQNGFCRAFPGVSKCMECSVCEGDLPVTRYCRFLEFRKLCILDNLNPVISVEGFADYNDVSVEDLVPWTPLKTGYGGMDESSALLVLTRVVPHFIAIVSEEAKTLPEEDVTPIWKRSVKGVRELCDTCETTLFNFHWVCRNCGFCVCPICYQHARDSNDGSEAVSSMQSPWPMCLFNNQPHRTSMLILAQIIPANVLAEVVSQALRICEAHNIDVNVSPTLHRLVHTLGRMEPVARFQNEGKKNKGAKSKPQQTPLVHQLPPHLMDASCFPTSSMNPALPPIGSDIPSLELPHSCSNGTEERLEAAPIEAPHLWLSDTLLCLLDPKHEQNMIAFQERWKRGQPVLVSGIHNHLDKQLWTPEAFERDFGNEPADLVDCRMGLVVLQVPCRTFWAGFNNMAARLRDPTSDEPRLLKLKDWPPVDDFSEKLPKRFADLMNALPLPEYTLRDAKLNMAASLPDFFVKPDLGPKMYNAYGSAAYPKFGTTNLHLDISDAVNVMVYCNTPPSVRITEKRLVEETVARECCPETSRRVRENGGTVGALWHIYAASDADKIRALLRKVFEERGLRQLVGTDPIHDQLIYLDSELRHRLYTEYGVKGWTIAQCVGDAIFIPAGAPHQVRNLCSCIKVAEDFVSPEHVFECLKLTEEFRQLSDRHANHEDKLQMKNIIYHSMKDIVGILKPSVK